MSILHYTEAAQRAYDSNAPSPWLPSSDMDEAHNVGLWARKHNIYPQEVSKCRGYKMKLNRDYVLDFKESDTLPKVSKV